MIANRLKYVLLAAVVSLALSPSARAGVITDFISNLSSDIGVFDFRDPIFAGCHGLVSCERIEPDAGGRTVIVSADTEGTLYRTEAEDGFGIQGGGEGDEIDGEEALKVEVVGGWLPTNIGITDLFGAPDGGGNGEEVIVEGFRDGGLVFSESFLQTDLLADNGEVVFDLPGLEIDFMLFTSTGEFNDDYALAMISGVATAIPEPDTVAIFGLALLMAGYFGRRKFAQKQT